MALSSTVNIDGSHGEGGGALVRTALALSCLTQQAVKIRDVRGGTKYPGIDAEDIALARALGTSCKADVSTFEKGGHDVEFAPTSRPSGFFHRVGEARSDLRSANALVLLTTIAPIAARSGKYSVFSLEGETYGMHALGYDAFTNCTSTVYAEMGLICEVDQVNAGFGRESAGLLNAEIEPSVLTGINWTTRGSLISAHATIAISDLPPAIGQRAAAHINRLAQSVNIPMTIEQKVVNGRGPGAHCTCSVRYENAAGTGSAIGARGLRTESVAQQAFEAVFDWMRSDATIDPYLADQILVPLCFAESGSTFRVSRLTQRLLTQIWVIKQFVPIRITVRGSENGPGQVTIER